MKKTIISTLLLINVFSLSCYGATYTTEQLINKIEKASVNMQTKKMQRLWKDLCSQDQAVCSEKKEWFDNILYKTKVRKHDIPMIQKW